MRLWSYVVAWREDRKTMSRSMISYSAVKTSGGYALRKYWWGSSKILFFSAAFGIGLTSPLYLHRYVVSFFDWKGDSHNHERVIEWWVTLFRFMITCLSLLENHISINLCFITRTILTQDKSFNEQLHYGFDAKIYSLILRKV